MERIDRHGSHRFVVHDGDGRRELREPLDDVSIGDLFKRMTSDASLLVRQEMSLARAELSESVRNVKEMTVKLAIAAALAIPGALALTAFLILALGEAINSYWGSALIVGAVLLASAAILARQGLRKAEDGKVGMERTAASLSDDARWGKEELRAFKRELTA